VKLKMNEQNTIKIERKSDGSIGRVKEGKRRGRPAGSGNPALKLICQVTSKARATNQNYLNGKASRLGVTVDEIISNYVSKEGLKQLQADNSLKADTREQLLRLNGGTRQRASKAVELKKAAK
jgi:hypothetical protein